MQIFSLVMGNLLYELDSASEFGAGISLSTRDLCGCYFLDLCSCFSLLADIEALVLVAESICSRKQGRF